MKNKMFLQIALFIWAAFIIGFVMIIVETAEISTCRYFDEKHLAAEKMVEAMNAIKDYRIDNDIVLTDPTRNNQLSDRLETGMLGYWLTPITTTSGKLEAKRTSTNPNFAAMIIDMFKAANIQKGDEIGVLFSGSFPALNVAVASAIEVFELKPYIMASIGASSYGANIPDFTYFDMHQYLYEQNIISNPIDLVSLGGENDVGDGWDNTVITSIEARIIASNVEYLKEEDFLNNITYRMNVIDEEIPKIKMFVNVGGNAIAIGLNFASFIEKNGLITQSKKVYSPDRGLIDRYLEQHIPVIHLLNIESLALQYDIEIDPIVSPVIGVGNVYYENKYHIGLIVSFFIVGVAPLIYFGYQKWINKKKIVGLK